MIAATSKEQWVLEMLCRVASIDHLSTQLPGILMLPYWHRVVVMVLCGFGILLLWEYRISHVGPFSSIEPPVVFVICTVSTTMAANNRTTEEQMPIPIQRIYSSASGLTLMTNAPLGLSGVAMLGSRCTWKTPGLSTPSSQAAALPCERTPVLHLKRLLMHDFPHLFPFPHLFLAPRIAPFAIFGTNTREHATNQRVDVVLFVRTSPLFVPRFFFVLYDRE
jgi:hypothetical protein